MAPDSGRLVRGKSQIERAASRIVVGDALTALKSIPDNTFRCCVTSPPYWGLRDYGVERQIGAELELPEYIRNISAVFEEVRRVLRPDGTLWLNLGNSYTSGNRNRRAPDRKNGAREMEYRPPTPRGLKPKDLIGIPWLVALDLQARGWHLRSDIIWYKPNCQPESVRDRPTQSHEYLFLLSRSESYYYNSDAIRESTDDGKGTRSKRSVWCVNTAPFLMAHFATFPCDLIEPCILAGSEPGDQILDPFFGAGTVGVVCEKLQRRFVGVELKREYAVMACARLGWPAYWLETFG